MILVPIPLEETFGKKTTDCHLLREYPEHGPKLIGGNRSGCRHFPVGDLVVLCMISVGVIFHSINAGAGQATQDREGH